MIYLIILLIVAVFSFEWVKGEETIKNIVVFGDSYSDTGNKQRLTNGPLWNEHLAVGWNASLYNFAFSGAVCNNDMYEQQSIPSIVDQVEMYYKQNMSLNVEETVIIFWVGVNDIHKIFAEYSSGDIQEQQRKVVECISTNIRNVRRIFSSNKFIVFGVPPLESMPYYANTELAQSRENAANQLNEQLTKEVEKMNKHLQNLELDFLDIHRLLDDITRQPQSFNIKNAKDPYWDACQGQCNDDIDSYVWWDKAHLTGGIHRLIANSILMAGSLSPETYLDDTVDVEKLLEEPNTHYKSPIYKASKNTGEIERLIQLLNEQKEKEKQQQQQQQQDQKHEDNIKQNTSTTATNHKGRNYLFYGITATLIVSLAFFIFVKRRRRTHLGALTNLINNNRGRFVPLRNNLDSEV